MLPLRELIESGCRPGELLWFGSDVPIVRADPGDSVLAATMRRREGMGEAEAVALGQRISEGEAWAGFGVGSKVQMAKSQRATEERGQAERRLRAVADDYLGRVRRYARCDEIEVKDDRALAKAIPADSLLVALEVDGESLSSTELAARVERWTSRGKGAVTFVIGGAEGIPAELSRRADARLSLSKLTLPHRLARVFLFEQLYRSLSILRGEPYARED